MTSSDEFQQRIRTSIHNAKKKLLKVDSQPTIELIEETETTLVVNEMVTPSGKEYFVIYRSATNTPLIKVPKGSYRYVYFGHLKKCRVFVRCKLLRVMFDRCEECTISIRTPIIGLVEVYKSSLINITFRIPNSLCSSPVPLVVIEGCKDIQLYQSLEELIYLMKESVGVIGYIVDELSGQRLQNYEMGKLFWDPQEQVFITLSKEKGFTITPYELSLTEISHTFMMNNPVSIDTSDDIFGSTPPIGRDWLSRMG